MVGLFFILFSLTLFGFYISHSMCVLLFFLWLFARNILFDSIGFVSFTNNVTVLSLHTHRSQWALHLPQWRNRYNHHGFCSLSSVLLLFFSLSKGRKSVCTSQRCFMAVQCFCILVVVLCVSFFFSFCFVSIEIPLISPVDRIRVFPLTQPFKSLWLLNYSLGLFFCFSSPFFSHFDLVVERIFS